MIVRSHAMVFAVHKFVAECEGQRVAMKLTLKDVEELADYWNYNRLVATHAVNIELKNFLRLCNLFDLDPREYFELQA